MERSELLAHYDEEKRRNPLLPSTVRVFPDSFLPVYSVVPNPRHPLVVLQQKRATERNRDPVAKKSSSFSPSWTQNSVTAPFADRPSLDINGCQLPRCTCPSHRNCFLHLLFPEVDPVHLRLLDDNAVFIMELTRLLREHAASPQEEIEINTIPRSSDTSSFVYWKNGKRHFPPPSKGELSLNLPFAPVTQPLFNWVSLEHLFENVLQPHADISKMEPWLSQDRALASSLEKLPHALNRTYPTITSSKSVSIEDLSNIIAQGTIIHNESDNILSAVVFKVPKAGGLEARMVWDGRAFDDLLVHHLNNLREKDKSSGSLRSDAFYKIPETPLPLVPDLVNKILEPKWNFISTIDAKNMFYQFKVRSRALRRFFGINIRQEERNYHLLLACLPQGISFAPSFAQHISLYVCRVLQEVVQQRCRLRNLPPIDFFATAWIDNFILLTKSASDRDFVCQVFDDIVGTDWVSELGCVGLHLQMKDWEHHDDKGDLTVLGIRFNVLTHLASPAPVKVKAVLELLSQIRPDAPITTRAFSRWFGLCQWMVYSTARAPLCMYPLVMDKIRNICRSAITSDDWDLPVSIDAALLEEMTNFTNTIVGSSRGHSPLPSSASGIWSDASRQAIAAFHDGFADISGNHLHGFFVRYNSTNFYSSPSTSFNDVPMMILELFTGYLSFQLLPHADVWISDNIPATRAYIRGHSGHSICDSFLRKWILSRRCPGFADWVDTNCMLADPLSRPNDPAVFKECGNKSHTRHQIRWFW